MSWVCKHDWKVLDKTVLPSAFEQASLGQKVKSMDNVRPIMFEKSVQVIVVCTKCGKKSAYFNRNPQSEGSW